MVKSSAPGFYYSILKPVVDGIKLTKEIDELLDVFEDYDLDNMKRNQAYSKACYLARKQAKLMGYTS